jgi:hypothetical protein
LADNLKARPGASPAGGTGRPAGKAYQIAYVAGRWRVFDAWSEHEIGNHLKAARDPSQTRAAGPRRPEAY